MHIPKKYIGPAQEEIIPKGHRNSVPLWVDVHACPETTSLQLELVEMILLPITSSIMTVALFAHSFLFGTGTLHLPPLLLEADTSQQYSL